MAIKVTEILGTDSISASRIVINDNFNILEDEINAIEVYLDPSAGTIESLKSIESKKIKIGDVNTPSIESDENEVKFNKVVTIKDDVYFNGAIYNANYEKRIDTLDGPTFNIDPINTSVSDYLLENINTGQFDIELEDAEDGRIITFIRIASTGDITIIPTNVILQTGKTKIELDDTGSSVTLKFIDDGWYIIASNGITLQ